MNSGLLASEHMFAFQKLCLCYLRTALSTEELKSAILSCVIPCKQDASFDNYSNKYMGKIQNSAEAKSNEA